MSGQAGVEITPQMIEAGAQVYNDWYDGKLFEDGVITEIDFVKAVYQKMASMKVRGSQP